MGFPSPAADYEEQRISLDKLLIQRPTSTYFVKASETSYRDGVMKDALLVVDSSASPCDGSIVVCAVRGEFTLMRYRALPKPHVVSLINGAMERLEEEDAVFGVVTYIINDARAGELDDCPVI